MSYEIQYAQCLEIQEIKPDETECKFKVNIQTFEQPDTDNIIFKYLKIQAVQSGEKIHIGNSDIIKREHIKILAKSD